MRITFYGPRGSRPPQAPADLATVADPVVLDLCDRAEARATAGGRLEEVVAASEGLTLTV